MDEHDHPTLGPGEFCEFAIPGHPGLERSAPPPWHDFDWPELFSRCDGELPDPQPQWEAAARWLHEILFGLVAPHRGKGDIHAVGLRCVALCLALDRRDLVSPKMVRQLQKAVYRAGVRRKAKP